MGCCQKKRKELLIDDSFNKDDIGDTADKNELDSNIIIKLTYSDFEPLKLLGRGSFGEVLLVRLKANKRIYAMKILNKSILKTKKQQDHTKTERDLMVKIKNPFIVNIKTAFQDESRLYIVSEFMQGGDMFFHMHDGQRVIFNNERTKFYAIEIVLALEELHANNMVYRDLKPENILLDAKGHVKLIDFGLSKIFDTENDKAFTICGTPQYLAPEILEKKGYNKAVDWWSLGCVMYEMLTGRLPFAIKRGGKINLDTYKRPVKYPESLKNDTKDFLQQLLINNPDDRLGSGPDGSKNVKKHPFFKGVNWLEAKQKKLKPPFIPKLKNDTDLRYFESTFTDEPIDKQKKINTKIDKNQETNNDYTGFSYVTGSVTHELINLANNNDGDSENI